MATLTIQKVNKRLGKNFNLQQGISEEKQSDSNTNYTDRSDNQAIGTKGNQYNIAIKRSLGMKWNETTYLNNCEIILQVMMQVQQVSNTPFSLEH